MKSIQWEQFWNQIVLRVEVVIKIDSRQDKQVKMEEKIESIKKQLN
jgi:uncharacterized protein YqgV (UPF0045/DUF77 family)